MLLLLCELFMLFVLLELFVLLDLFALLELFVLFGLQCMPFVLKLLMGHGCHGMTAHGLHITAWQLMASQLMERCGVACHVKTRQGRTCWRACPCCSCNPFKFCRSCCSCF